MQILNQNALNLFVFHATDTVNQLLFATTLFCDITKINWFMVTNLCNQDVDYLENNIPETLEDWFTGEKYLPGYHEDAFVNLAKFSRT